MFFDFTKRLATTVHIPITRPRKKSQIDLIIMLIITRGSEAIAGTPSADPTCVPAQDEDDDCQQRNRSPTSPARLTLPKSEVLNMYIPQRWPSSGRDVDVSGVNSVKTFGWVRIARDALLYCHVRH